MVMKNPFVTNGYAGPEYFCARCRKSSAMSSSPSLQRAKPEA